MRFVKGLANSMMTYVPNMIYICPNNLKLKTYLISTNLFSRRIQFSVFKYKNLWGVYLFEGGGGLFFKNSLLVACLVAKFLFLFSK